MAGFHASARALQKMPRLGVDKKNEADYATASVLPPRYSHVSAAELVHRGQPVAVVLM